MKLRRIIASLACLLVLAGNCLAIDLVIDGEKLELDVPPQLVEQRTLVPLRAIFEKLGATVEWDQATQTATATKGTDVVQITIDSTTAYVNGEAKELLGDIRERAGLPRENAATKAELQNQRRCELAFEFQPSRHIDVIRWGLAQEYYAKPLHSVVSKMVDGQIKTEEVEVYPGRTFNPTYNKVFPIPETAFNGTVNLKQNKGY